MSSLFAFLVAVLYVCLGCALGIWMTRRVVGRKPARRRIDSGATETGMPMTSDEASTFLERIQQVTSDVDEDVGRHATRVAEISGELSADGSQDSAGVLAAASRLIDANRTLQQDLAAARAEIQSQRSQLDAYMQQAVTDPLTALSNRRGFDQEMTRRIAHLRRGGPPLALVMVDVDHFKQFNDQHGHPAGDAVLSQVADVLADSTRQMDFLARYGGEEFGVVLPGTTLDEARVVAERIRSAMEQHPFDYRGTQLFVTVSAGVAEARATDDAAAVVERADQALYAAKRAGRNQCYLHDGERPQPIEKRLLRSQRKAESTQRIAPFIDGRFPEPGMFRDIVCEDLSATDFTYVVSERPEYDKVLVALGESADCAYTTATVRDCRNIGSDAAPLYRIACRFTAPVEDFAPSVAG